MRKIRDLFRASLVAALALTASGAANAAPTLTNLWSFAGGGAHPSDGASPSAGLLSDRTSALYSTTGEGGNMSCPLGGGAGCGTVFKLTPPSRAGGAWTETVLYSFMGGSDGASPVAGLISDRMGVLYGTTSFGGAFKKGVVFKLRPPKRAGHPWTETVLYSFMGGSDGAAPSAGLILDASGALYGTTESGGNTSCHRSYLCGTVFKLAASASFRKAVRIASTKASRRWPRNTAALPPRLLRSATPASRVCRTLLRLIAEDSRKRSTRTLCFL